MSRGIQTQYHHGKVLRFTIVQRLLNVIHDPQQAAVRHHAGGPIVQGLLAVSMFQLHETGACAYSRQQFPSVDRFYNRIVESTLQSAEMSGRFLRIVKQYLVSKTVLAEGGNLTDPGQIGMVRIDQKHVHRAEFPGIAKRFAIVRTDHFIAKIRQSPRGILDKEKIFRHDPDFQRIWIHCGNPMFHFWR